MTQGLVPGSFVRHPDRSDWGVGQIQSVSAGRATVNFENAGKQTIIMAEIDLVTIDPGNLDPS